MARGGSWMGSERGEEEEVEEGGEEGGEGDLELLSATIVSHLFWPDLARGASEQGGGRGGKEQVRTAEGPGRAGA